MRGRVDRSTVGRRHPVRVGLRGPAPPPLSPISISMGGDEGSGATSTMSRRSKHRTALIDPMIHHAEIIILSSLSVD